MLNRRILRVKVLQGLYSYYFGELDLGPAYANLNDSIKKIYHSYLHLLSLPLTLKDEVDRERDVKVNTAKYVKKTTERFNLMLNPYFYKLEENQGLHQKLKETKLNWVNHKDFVSSLYKALKKEKQFQAYNELPTPNLDEHFKTLEWLVCHWLRESDVLDTQMEEIYPSWLNDKPVVFAGIQKSIAALKENKTDILQPLSQQDEEDDIAFVKKLFHKTIARNEEFDKYISTKTQNWDVERIAVIDMLILKLGLCELTEFDEIPVKVTINEYLEISKTFSTPKSKNFINGVLDSLKNELKEQGLIVKRGRGLVE